MKSESNEVDEEKPQPCESTALLNVPQRGLLHLSYWKRLERNFGWRLLFLLWVVQHLMKGLCHRMTMRAVPYVFQAYAVDAPQAQVFQGLIMLPWAVKPILGLGSDLVPVMGFRKGPYMITATLLSIGAFTCIIGSTTSLSATVMCIMLIVLQFSTCDLLSEAQYATKIQEVPNAGPDLLSYVWAGIDIFGLLAMFCSGPILEAYGYRGAFVFAALPAALVLVPVSMGCLQEKRISSEDLTRIRRRYFEQRETCFLCLMMFCGTLVIMCVGFLQRDPCINFAVALVTAMFILGACCVCLTPVVAKANAFSVLYTGFNASISGATFYFYTDSKDIYPAGPHFSDFFFNTVLGTVGSVFALLGILFYQQYLSSMSYRKLIVFTSLIMLACSLLDVMMFARLNVHWGIPDHYMVLGLSIFEGVVMQWQWMPQVVLLAALAPRGMEATMLALLAGCHNLGATLGSNFGAVLLEILHVKPRGRSGDAQQFENLWMAAAISSVLLLLVALFLQYLLPDCRQTEKITETNPTENSLLRRWLKS